jgi:putative membrane protein
VTDAPMSRSVDIFRIERPDPALMKWYFLRSFVAGPLFLLPLAYFWFRFRTLRYRFDEEGISMSWGALFRREIHLTYARIQDIHLASHLVERWLGLARIEIQTASGRAKAEMTLEGILESEAVRDFLYARMRGMRDVPGPADPAARPAVGAPTELRPEPRPESWPMPGGAGQGDAELAAVLREVAGELRAMRSELAGSAPSPAHDPGESEPG